MWPAVICRSRLGPGDREAGGGLLLHPDLDGPLVVLEDLLDVGGAVLAARADAVEPLGVLAGPVVDLQPVGVADLQLVVDRADLDASR